MAVTQELIFCTKCKQKTSSVDMENTTVKNGRPATRARCADCNTKKMLLGKHVAV